MCSLILSSVARRDSEGRWNNRFSVDSESEQIMGDELTGVDEF